MQVPRPTLTLETPTPRYSERNPSVRSIVRAQSQAPMEKTQIKVERQQLSLAPLWEQKRRETREKEDSQEFRLAVVFPGVCHRAHHLQPPPYGV